MRFRCSLLVRPARIGLDVLAPAEDGLSREEVAEVHELLDVVPTALAQEAVQEPATAPVLDEVVAVPSRVIDDARVLGPDRADPQDASWMTERDAPPVLARPSSGLMAPVPDEW